MEEESVRKHENLEWERGERETEGQEEGEEARGEREAYVIWGMWSCRNSGKTVQPLSFPEWLFGARHCAICFLCSITWTTPSSSCGFISKMRDLIWEVNTGYSVNEKQIKFSPSSVFTVPKPFPSPLLVSFQNIPKDSPCLAESHMISLKEMYDLYSPTLPLYRWEAKEILWASCILSKARRWARNQA